MPSRKTTSTSKPRPQVETTVVRVAAEVVHALRTQAKAEGLSLGALCSRILAAELKRNPPPKSKVAEDHEFG